MAKKQIKDNNFKLANTEKAVGKEMIESDTDLKVALEDDYKNLTDDFATLIDEISMLKKRSAYYYWLIGMRYYKMKTLYFNGFKYEEYQTWKQFCQEVLTADDSTINKFINVYQRISLREIHDFPSDSSKVLLIGNIKDDTKRNQILKEIITYNRKSGKDITIAELKKLTKTIPEKKSEIEADENIENKETEPEIAQSEIDETEPEISEYEKLLNNFYNFNNIFMDDRIADNDPKKRAAAIQLKDLLVKMENEIINFLELYKDSY